MSVKRYDYGYQDGYSADGMTGLQFSDDGALVKYEDYAALEARCAALAVENALLKKSEPAPFSKLMMEALDAYLVGAEEVPELAMLSAYKKLRNGLKTPATDAFLAEVRAQGVEMAIEHIEQTICPNHETILSELAAQLRKGVQS